MCAYLMSESYTVVHFHHINSLHHFRFECQFAYHHFDVLVTRFVFSFISARVQICLQLYLNKNHECHNCFHLNHLQNKCNTGQILNMENKAHIVKMCSYLYST